MKRRCFAWLLCLLLCPLVLTASAAELSRVIDEAGLLTDLEETQLEEESRRIREAYGVDVVIVTVWSLGGKTPAAYADDYFDYNGYGLGEDYSGMLFLLSMEYQDWYVSTHGKAVEAMTDYAIDRSVEAILPELSQGNYGLAFTLWIRNLCDYMDRWQNGDPVDVPDGQVPSGVRPRRFHYGLPLLIGFVAAAAVVFAMVAMHRTNRPQSGATGYLDTRSFRVFNRRDLFLHSHVSKVRRSQSTPSSSGSRGGSSVHRSSSGRSHGGRGGKF